MDGKELQRYNELMSQVQYYRGHCAHLEAELQSARPALFHASQQISELKASLATRDRELEILNARVAELTGQLAHTSVPPASPPPADPPLPAFVKANVPAKIRKRPGRKPGHEPAHRPMPATIDTHIHLPAPLDPLGKPSCPRCHVQLSRVRQHERIVEDIIPAKVHVTCYHTTSGYCPGCRKHVETRAPEQPPSGQGDFGQSQIGINALATAAMMRIEYRLPYRLICQLLADLPGLSLSPGAVAKQVQRMGRWLESQYDRLRIFLRYSKAVHMDETSWRVDGKNQWLWTLLDPTHTLFHIAPSRGQKVVRELLGDVFGGTLITDFYAGYAAMDCKKQKCLVHLLRELKETAKENEAFANGKFHRRLKRLIKELILLKKQKGTLSKREYESRGRRLENRLISMSKTDWCEPEANRLANRLARHARELTTFLWVEGVEATNNAAERALRPAVVMRKITGGSRSDRGAKATAVLMSVLRTAKQQGRPLFETIKTLLENAWAGKNPGLLTDVQ